MIAAKRPEAVERGRSNRRKGHDAERQLAEYLRQWWHSATRKSDNGWRKDDLVSADHGDIKGTPGICWQVKYVAALNVFKSLASTVEQTIAAEADYGILVERREGKADPGRWWAWLTVLDLGRLIGPDDEVLTRLPSSPALVAPVRMEVRHLVSLLLLAGYGDSDRTKEGAA